MSDIDSDEFDDEDELVKRVVDEDDDVKPDDEYDCTYDDEEGPDEHVVPAKDKKASATVVDGGQKNSNGGDQLKVAYVQRNGVAYLVPLVKPGEEGQYPGRTRDYGVPVVVEDNEVLGNMNQPRNWPKPDVFDYKSIVIIKAKHNEDDVIPPDPKEGYYGWYARVITKKDAERGGSQNYSILKLIPKVVCKALIKRIGKDTSMTKSTLVHQQPSFENAKPFPIAPNGWARCQGIKGTGTVTKNKSNDMKTASATASNADNNGDLSDDDEVMKTAPSPSVAKAVANVANVDNEDPCEEVDKAKPPVKKGGILDSFRKSMVASSSKGPARCDPENPKQADGKVTVDDANKKATPDTKESAATNIKSVTEITAAKRPGGEGSSKAKRTDDGVVEVDDMVFKRVRYAEVDNKDSTVTFWKDNRLYIVEP